MPSSGDPWHLPSNSTAMTRWTSCIKIIHGWVRRSLWRLKKTQMPAFRARGIPSPSISTSSSLGKRISMLSPNKYFRNHQRRSRSTLSSRHMLMSTLRKSWTTITNTPSRSPYILLWPQLRSRSWARGQGGWALCHRSRRVMKIASLQYGSSPHSTWCRGLNSSKHLVKMDLFPVMLILTNKKTKEMLKYLQNSKSLRRRTRWSTIRKSISTKEINLHKGSWKWSQ